MRADCPGWPFWNTKTSFSFSWKIKRRYTEEADIDCASMSIIIFAKLIFLIMKSILFFNWKIVSNVCWRLDAILSFISFWLHTSNEIGLCWIEKKHFDFFSLLFYLQNWTSKVWMKRKSDREKLKKWNAEKKMLPFSLLLFS